MNSLLLWLLVGLVACGSAAWRVVASRRAAAARAARESAAAVAPPQARQAAAGGPSAPAVARAPALPTGVRPVPADRSADARATARAQAARVIAAETQRRQAALEKARNIAQAEEQRRGAEAASLERTRPLPRAIAVPPAAARPAAVAPTPARPAAPRRELIAKTPAQTVILMVDDSKMVRVKTTRLLEANGYKVVTAVDGLDAIRQLESCRPDLVITDVDMPNMDGFGLVRHLRGQAATAALPIVMITSSEDRHREMAVGMGVGLVLGKPYPEDGLVAHIRAQRFVTSALQEPALA